MTKQPDAPKETIENLGRARLNKLATDIRANWQAHNITGNWKQGEEREQRLLDEYYKALEADRNKAKTEQIRRMISDAEDELHHEKAYANNHVNIEYYKSVIKFLKARWELQSEQRKEHDE